MNEDALSNNNSEHGHADEPVATLDLLITRLADGDADENDWLEFQRLASADHQPWQRLAEEQWLVRRLREGFDLAIAKAAGVELPDHLRQTAGSTDSPIPFAPHHAEPVRRRFAAFSGWAVAAVVMLAWVLTVTGYMPNANRPMARNEGREIPPKQDQPLVQPGIQPAAPMGTLVTDAQPEELLNQYLSAPHIVRELEPVPLQMRLTTQGQEVTFMRRIIERRSVQGMYQIMVDEDGNRRLVPRTLVKQQPEEIY